MQDYDESRLHRRTETKFTNIAAELIEEHNRFIELDELQLEFPVEC